MRPGAGSLLGMLLATAVAAPGATFTVTTTVDTADGVCDAHCSLREAIGAANTAAGADTLLVPPGVYGLAIPGALEDANGSGDLDVSDDVVLQGAGARQTILDGRGLDRVVHVINAGVELDDVTVRGGVLGSGQNGAGVAAFGGGLILRRAVLSGNVAGNDGGGVYAGAAHLTVLDSTVSGNRAARGGGLYYQGFTRQFDLRDSTVSGNTAAIAGGLFVDLECGVTAPCAIAGSTIADNRGSAGVGGVQNIAPLGSLTMINSIVADNPGGNCASGSVVSLGHNLGDDGSCPFTAAGDQAASAAGLLPLRANGGPTDTHALAVGSAALDHGDGAACAPADQRGQPRAGACDVGAFEATAGPCGDGITDLGEACDDGNGADDDCCTTACAVAADASSCAADGDPCTRDTCDGAAARCEHAATPLTGCRPAGRSLLTLRAGGDVSWKWLRGAATTAADFGAPAVAGGTHYALCVYAAEAPAALVGIGLPTGGSGWSAGASTLRYRDGASRTKLLLRGGGVGRARAQLQAAGAPAALPLGAGALVAQLSNDTPGVCWESRFEPADVVRDDATAFKAKAEP